MATHRAYAPGQSARHFIPHFLCRIDEYKKLINLKRYVSASCIQSVGINHPEKPGVIKSKQQTFPVIAYTIPSNGQDNLDTHVLSLVHNLAIDENLVDTNSVALLICGICCGGDLDFTPLSVGRHQLSLGSEFLELLVDTLFLDTAHSLN